MDLLYPYYANPKNEKGDSLAKETGLHSPSDTLFFPLQNFYTSDARAIRASWEAR